MLNFTNDGINEFTLDCDRFLLYKGNDCMRTYLWNMGEVQWFGDVGGIAFRVPGATRGNIKIDKEYRIIDVVFFYDVCFSKIKCYDSRIVDFIKNKYVGSKFDCTKVFLRTRENYKALDEKLTERSTDDARG